MTLDGIRLPRVDAHIGAHPAGCCCHALGHGDMLEAWRLCQVILVSITIFNMQPLSAQGSC